MKKVLMVLLAVMCIATVSAQFKLGLKAGVNLSEASFTLGTLNPDNMTGFQAGPVFEFMIPVLGLGIDGGVLYSQQGFTLDEETFRQNTVDIPLNLKYKFNLIVVGAYLSAGPYARFSLSNNHKEQWETESFGAGLNFGGGIELFSKLQIGVNYQLGLTNDYATLDWSAALDEIEGKPRIWSVSATYFF